ncbi:MAG TPA: ABC transporter substrate-binding protein [Solirubrobacter sp.]|nr:ABC transporter substrate-binding protein [Solirubrobacter sp.]
MRRSAWTMGVALLAALSLGVAACGGDDGDEGGNNQQQQTTQGNPNPSGGKPGGKLTVLWAGDMDYSDCGQAYYQASYMICYATQRPLYSYKPDDGVNMVPDLAEALPEVSPDGKTVTVKIRKGVKFSPPVNREVTSKDVKYAMERMFFSTVATGYSFYFDDIVGSEPGAKPGTEIEGIETPDDYTIVFKLEKATGGVMASGSLGLPATAPVPKEYAEKFDKETPTTYGEHQVATGPYMIENDAEGNTIGYEPQKRIHLVRNPNWDKKTDYKPAYLDEIDNVSGNDDPDVASRRILTGDGMVNGDWTPGPASLKLASDQYKDQLVIVPGATIRYISLNTTVEPFDDINVRKAVNAAFDRNALRLARGGPLIGDIATHYLPPTIAGFEEAGGMKGTGVDFLSVDGKPNDALAAEYMKKAGYASGKYEGNEKLLMVASNQGTAPAVAQIAKEQFEKLGFNVTLRLVTTNTMYTKFCSIPDANVASCPSAAWGKDFSDGQTMLDPVFNGNNITKQANNNYAELDVPEINDKMEAAKLLTDPKERAAAWGEADRMITAQAPGVPWLWDKWPNIRSANVNGVVNLWNTSWDLTFTSLK